MDTGFVVDRIYGLCVDKGYKKKHLCDLLGVRPSYLQIVGLKISIYRMMF